MAGYAVRKLIRPLPGVVIKAVPKPEPEITEGFSARGEIGSICLRAGRKSALLVTDKTLFSLGYHEKIVSSLKDAGIPCTVFCDIASEPTSDIVEAGIKAALACRADCVIALGGGSVLDSGKMIAAGAKLKREKSRSLLLRFLPIPGKTLPMISIPSTAGTGAELTVCSMVTHSGNGKKAPTVLVGLNVTNVILDGELTVNAPHGITCACGIDALSHGLEGAVSTVKVPDEDVRKSRECVKLVLENLGTLSSDPENREARQNMCRAALYGGNAINKQLAGYVHAFAHSIGAKYHLAHGNAIALSLLPVMKFQKKNCIAPLAELAAYCHLAKSGDTPAEAADRLIDAVGALIESCAFPDLGAFIPKADYDSLAKLIAADSINYSPPVVLKKADIFRLLDEINGTKGEVK